MESAILPWPTESIRARLGDTVAPLLNLQALRTDCSGNYTHEVTTVEGTSYTWDACYPSLVLTGSISTQFPGWGGCSLINNIFDPPMYLTPGPNLPANPAPSNGPAPGPPAQTTSGMKLSTREPLSYRPTPSPPQPVVDSSPEATNGPKYQGGFPNVNGQTSGELPSSTGSEGNSDSSAPYDQSNPQLPSSGGDAQSSPSNDPAANDDGSTRNGGTIPNNTPGFSGDAAPSGGSSSSNPGALNNDNPNLGDFMMSIIRNIPGSGVPTNSAGNGYAGGSINQAAPTIPTSPNGTTGQPSGIVLATNAGFKLDTSLYAMLSLLAGTFCVFLL